MTITIENETETSFGFSEKELIEKVIMGCMDYEDCPYEADVNVLLTDNESIRQINLEQRGIDSPTDVLSFPMADFDTPADFEPLEEASEDYFNPETGELLLGDIVISTDKVFSQAEEYGHTPQRELAFLVAHSMLHLFGYDHMEEGEREEMERRQREILNGLGITR